jgi:hypothetical protein
VDALSQPWETIDVICVQCRGKFKVPAARRRRERRLGIDKPDLCSRRCNQLFVAIKGREAQNELLKSKKPTP